MTVEHVLRVFVDAEGGHGNPLGVVMDTADWTDEQCQTRAAELGYSETVFVDDAASGRIRIFTPSVRFPFAGHPTVGTAWLLHRLGFPVRGLETDAGLVEVLVDEDRATVWALPQWAPPFDLIELESADAVDEASPSAGSARYVWAWLDEPEGIVRARSFVPEAGIAEDEATGAAAIRLAAQLGQSITILQGVGSVLEAAPDGDRIRLRGRVADTES